MPTQRESILNDSALHASRNCLQPADAEQPLMQYGLNTIRAQQQAGELRLLLSHYKSPLFIILPLPRLSPVSWFAEARNQIGRFIEEVYLHKRIHSRLGYLTLVLFE